MEVEVSASSGQHTCWPGMHAEHVLLSCATLEWFGCLPAVPACIPAPCHVMLLLLGAPPTVCRPSPTTSSCVSRLTTCGVSGSCLRPSTPTWTRSWHASSAALQAGGQGGVRCGGKVLVCAWQQQQQHCELSLEAVPTTELPPHAVDTGAVLCLPTVVLLPLFVSHPLSPDCITAANEANAAKDKALGEASTLKLAAEREHAAFEEEWRQLTHLIEDDRCLCV